MDDTYQTVARSSEALYKVKGSKHFGFCFPVTHEEEIRAHLDELRKVHHSARHHCYAWRLSPDGNHYRANDDGEPSNSAGKPILGQLQSFNLTNTLVVVVRYFGGTKLGVGGLIDAYRTAAKMAIEANEIVQEYVTEEVSINFNYNQMGAVMKVLNDRNLQMKQHHFDAQCSLTVAVRASGADELRKALEKAAEWGES
jgi:uncharacterized YigZ family protein